MEESLAEQVWKPFWREKTRSYLTLRHQMSHKWNRTRISPSLWRLSCSAHWFGLSPWNRLAPIFLEVESKGAEWIRRPGTRRNIARSNNFRAFLLQDYWKRTGKVWFGNTPPRIRFSAKFCDNWLVWALNGEIAGTEQYQHCPALAQQCSRTVFRSPKESQTWVSIKHEMTT